MAVEVSEANEFVEAYEVKDAAGPFKACKITTKDFIVIQMNSALFWCFENKILGGRIMKSQVWF